jgi:hypothetical protein
MSKTTFYVNSAMICHNCCRTAVIRLKESRKQHFPISREKDVLEITFVSCGVCLTLPHVYDPIAATFSKYVELQSYSSVIDSLVYIFGCLPRIAQEKTFSFKDLGMKNSVMIRDITTIFDVSNVPDSHIMILKGGCEVLSDCKFFRHEALTARFLYRRRFTSVFCLGRLTRND